MAGKTNRQFAGIAADAGDQAGAFLGELVIGAGEAVFLQQITDVFGTGALIAGRVDSVKAQQFPS